MTTNLKCRTFTYENSKNKRLYMLVIAPKNLNYWEGFTIEISEENYNDISAMELSLLKAQKENIEADTANKQAQVRYSTKNTSRNTIY